MKLSQKEELIALIREKSYKEGDFTLSSGAKSTFYIDMKGTTLHPKGAKLIGQIAVDILSKAKIKIQGVGGLTLGADPIATAVSLIAYALKLEWPAFIVRKESKSHGTHEYVEGKANLLAGAQVIVLEDVVTTGASSMKAIERLRAEGFNPVAVLTVVDREQGAREFFEAAKMPFFAMIKLSELRK